MTNSQVSSPENIVAEGDPGDETASRYRYQWIWAAVVCCMLLDDTEDVEEVFCEHHEDVLLKHRDGTFTGHQVKTRGDDQPPWKASDESVRGACVRFARLEDMFPGCFREYRFLTNHQLYCAGNGKDLAHVLKLIRDASTVADLPNNATNWLRRIARDAGVAEDVAFAAMSKTIPSADLPKLRDAVIRLVDAIAQNWSAATECSHGAVKSAAYSLIEECTRASSLDHQQLLPAYIVATASTDADEKTALINGKRITAARVIEILESGRDSTATLDGNPAEWVIPGAGSTDLLHRKLNAGGFSAVTINSADDLRDKADYLGISWTNRFGNTKGLARYDHVRTLVLSDAGRAFDASQTNEDKFGPQMRENLRNRFRERRANGDQLFDCADEHLEGMAFSLTAQCKIVWSHARPWEDE